MINTSLAMCTQPCPWSPQPATQLQTEFVTWRPHVPGLCLELLSCSHTPTWMCLLLLKLLPLFTCSVFWVERLPLVISGDDLPMERALYNKHKVADGQEIAPTALGEMGTAKPSNHVPSSQRGRSGERQHQESKNWSAYSKQLLSVLYLCIMYVLSQPQVSAHSRLWLHTSALVITDGLSEVKVRAQDKNPIHDSLMSSG